MDLRCRFLLGLCVALSAAAPAGAQCVRDLSTGFDQLAAAVIPEGQPDDDYTVDSGAGPEPSLTGGATSGFPIPPWVPSTDRSLWVSAAANATAPPGLYTYQITFELPDGPRRARSGPRRRNTGRGAPPVTPEPSGGRHCPAS